MTSTLGSGFRVGHWTDSRARTGCTVILPPANNVTSCDIRGSSPSSRELALLHPDRRLTEIHALVLTGGSAFGLAAADGVTEWLAERSIGYRAGVARVPIVPAAVIFDLRSADGPRPGAEAGRAACEDARTTDIATGLVGAGAGATVGKWAGFEHAAPGGLGLAHAVDGRHEVSALAVVNSVGDVVADDGTTLAGTGAPDPGYRFPAADRSDVPSNTVLALVVIRGRLDKREVRWLAARGSDGVTQTIRPAHTRYDGDVTFAVAAPSKERAGGHDLDVLGSLATNAVAGAIRAAVEGN